MASTIRSALTVFTLALAACGGSSTHFVSTWRSPTAREVQPTGLKVLAVFMGPPAASLRRAAEDAMVRELVARGFEGAPAYAVLGDGPLGEEEARRRLSDLGFSGALIMRLIGQETTYRIEAYSNGPQVHLWGAGFWGWGWERAGARLVPDRTVAVESTVYSLEQYGELVWAGVSRTVNPADVDGLVSELAAEVAHELVRARLLAKKP
jgi:hypothetical protein